MRGLIAAVIIISGMVPELYAELVKVEVRTGDTLHGFASKYLKDPSQWPQIYEINSSSIKNPDRIFPGQIIRIPVEMLKDKIGDISVIRKEVQIKKREGSRWEDPHQGERLFPEDGIMTGSQSFARVDFLVGSSLKVYENSLIYLKPTESKTAVASLLEGGLNARLTRIITPSAEVIPRGHSEYDVNIDKKDTTRVSVRDGEVDVKASGKTVTVIKGYRTLVRKDEEPEEPRKLPLAVEEPSGKDESSTDFLIQVAGSKKFDDPLLEKTTRGIDLEEVRKGLDPGRYFWRAAVIDSEGFRGDFSDPKPLNAGSYSSAFVELTGFEIMNREEGVMRIRGISSNAARVVINGYPADMDDQGRFTTTIVLYPGQQTITVTAFSDSGVVLRKYHRSDSGMWLPVR